jgi:hypothetical protein
MYLLPSNWKDHSCGQRGELPTHKAQLARKLEGDLLIGTVELEPSRAEALVQQAGGRELGLGEGVWG